MPSTMPRNLHTIPISSRPPSHGFRQRLLALSFALLFNAGCCLIHGSQLLFLVPLRLVIVLVPLPLLRHLHEEGVRWTKGSFARLLVLVCQWFSPTRMLVTFEGDNLKEEDVVIRDSSGHVVKLELPEKLVMVANHQMYADWLYLWCLIYRSNLHKDVLILLKASLKWLPIIGWGMQIYHFIFLARSWASDRLLLSEKLSRLAARAQLLSTPIALMIFPEGTLVSKDTRPISKKFAEKTGIEDMRHTLLPRSTGLLYCLRSLSPQTPGLHLLDVTIAYEGIPPLGYGQSYYTLRSIFFDGVPPPRIHLHLRLFDVAKQVPIGDLSSKASSKGGAPGVGHPPPAGLSRAEREKDMDPTPEEASVFEQWLRKLWRDKDVLFERFLATGSFSEQAKSNVRDSGVSVGTASATFTSGVTEIPVELRSRWEILDAFSCFVPVLAAVLIWALGKRVG